MGSMTDLEPEHCQDLISRFDIVDPDIFDRDVPTVIAEAGQHQRGETLGKALHARLNVRIEGVAAGAVIIGNVIGVV
jgi:hypothetical protein